MYRYLTIVLMLALSLSAHALQVFNSADTNLGGVDKLKCGSNMSCSKVNGRLLMACSSQTGANNANADLVLAADNSDDNGDDWTVRSTASGNSLQFMNDTSGSAVAKLTVSTGGALTIVGAVTGDGGDALSGFLSKQVAATATTITAAQCGSTFINAGAIEMELPEASTVLGCELTFIVGHASNFTVDPEAADIIVLATNAAGDSLIADAIGEVLKIQAISASTWAPMIKAGTWTDSD